MSRRAPKAHQTVAAAWGKRVTRRREELDLTQAEVARRAGLSQPTISAIEHGDYGLNPELLIRLAIALGVEVDDLFDWPVGLATMARYANDYDLPLTDDEQVSA